jgi:FK506-binding protein 1
MRSSTVVSILVSLCTVQSGHAWSTPTGSSNNQVSRKSVLQTLVQGGVATVSASLLVQQPAWAGEKLASGVTVEVVKAGNGAKPEVGELVAIRFAAYADGRKIDDIFDTPEPYYTRMGSGGLLKGVESTLPLMTLGDRWKLTIPVRKRKKRKN